LGGGGGQVAAAGGDEIAEAGVGDEPAVAQRAAGERVLAAEIRVRFGQGVSWVDACLCLRVGADGWVGGWVGGYEIVCAVVCAWRMRLTGAC
jgi:hypothetical protein